MYVRRYPGGWKNKPDPSTPWSAAAGQHIEDGLVAASAKAEAAVPNTPEGRQAFADSDELKGTYVTGLAAPYLGNKFAFLGDSITWGYPGGKNAWCDYASIFSNGRIQKIFNAGVSSNHTADMLARLDVDVIAKGVNACTVLGGINDIQANVPAETTHANLTAIYETLAAAKIRPVLMCLLAATTATTPQRAAIVALNAWIRAYGKLHGYDVIDLYDMSLDTATGGMKASWTADGLHPGLAYHLIGKAVSDFLSPRLPIPKTLLALAATERRNLVDNALMLVDTNADGVPDTWSAANGSGFTHSVATPAPGTDVEGNWAVVTMATASTGRRLDWSTFGRLSLGLAFASPGDRIAYAVRVSLAPGADAGGVSVFAQVDGATIHTAAGALQYAVDGIAYGEFTIPSTWTTGRLGIAVSAGTGAGVYKIAQPVILNLTRQGTAFVTDSTPVTPTPGDGLSGTAVNAVVATDSFTRTGELVGSAPTTGRAGVVYAGATGQLVTDGSKAVGTSGAAGSLVLLDVLAKGDITLNLNHRFSTQEPGTKTQRLYAKYIDASNHIFINMATPGTTFACTVLLRVGGVQRTLSTFAGSTVPSNTPVAAYPVTFSVIGTAVSVTINGVTMNSTLTSPEAAALANSSRIGFTAQSVNHGLDDLSVLVNGTYV